MPRTMLAVWLVAVGCGEDAPLAPLARPPPPPEPTVVVEQLGAAAAVHRFAWLPGDRMVAMLGTDLRAVVWDTETGRVVETRNDVPDTIEVAVDVTGTRVRFGGLGLSLSDGSWTTHWGELRWGAHISPGFDRVASFADGMLRFTGPEGLVTVEAAEAEVHWSPDGTRVAACGAGDVVLYEPTGTHVASWAFPAGPGVRPARCAFSPNGAYLVAEREVHWNTPRDVVVLRTSPLEVAATPGDLSEVAVSPSGALYAGIRRVADVWTLVVVDLASGAERASIPVSWVDDVGWASEDLLVVPSREIEASVGGGVYSLAEGAFLHHRVLESVAQVASDGRLVRWDEERHAVVLEGRDGTELRALDAAEVWHELDRGGLVVVGGAHPTFYDDALSPSPAGCGGGEHHLVGRTAAGESVVAGHGCVAIGTEEHPAGTLDPISLSDDGEWVVGIEAYDVVVRSIRDGTVRSTLGGRDPQRPTCSRGADCRMPIQLSPDGAFVAVAHDADLSIFDAATGDVVATASVPPRTRELRFSPDGRTLLHVATNAEVHALFRVPSLELVHTRPTAGDVSVLTSELFYEESALGGVLVTLATGAAVDVPLEGPASELALEGEHLIRALGASTEIVSWPARERVATIPGVLLGRRGDVLSICDGHAVIQRIGGEPHRTSIPCEGARLPVGEDAVFVVSDGVHLRRVSDGAELDVRFVASEGVGALLLTDDTGPLDDSRRFFLARGPAIEPDALRELPARGVDLRGWLTGR